MTRSATEPKPATFNDLLEIASMELNGSFEQQEQILFCRAVQLLVSCCPYAIAEVFKYDVEDGAYVRRAAAFRNRAGPPTVMNHNGLVEMVSTRRTEVERGLQQHKASASLNTDTHDGEASFRRLLNEYVAQYAPSDRNWFQIDINRYDDRELSATGSATAYSNNLREDFARFMTDPKRRPPVNVLYLLAYEIVHGQLIAKASAPNRRLQSLLVEPMIYPASYRSPEVAALLEQDADVPLGRVRLMNRLAACGTPELADFGADDLTVARAVSMLLVRRWQDIPMVRPVRAQNRVKITAALPRPTLLIRGPDPDRSLFGRSPEMRQVGKFVSGVAKRPAECVVLTGQVGTGKRTIARIIEYLTSGQTDPEIYCCGQTPNDGATLFGTAEQEGVLARCAHATVIIRNLHRASPDLQDALVDVIKTHKFRPLGSAVQHAFDGRLVFTALPAARAQGFFTQLQPMHCELPPLRDRGDDAAMLARLFLQRCAAAEAGAKPGDVRVDPDLVKFVRSYDWPDNVQQLEVMIRKLVRDAPGADHYAGATLTKLCKSWGGDVSHRPGQHTFAYTVPCDFAAEKRRFADCVMSTALNIGETQAEAARLIHVSSTAMHKYLNRKEGSK